MPAGSATRFQAPLGPAVFESLDRARASLVEAVAAATPAERYAAAHVAALRMAAAVLAARARPATRRGQRNAWTLLTRVAPELSEWAAFFAAGAGKRAAAEAGLGNSVTLREADDLLRDSERFLAVVERTLDLPHQAALPHGVDAPDLSPDLSRDVAPDPSSDLSRTLPRQGSRSGGFERRHSSPTSPDTPEARQERDPGAAA